VFCLLAYRVNQLVVWNLIQLPRHSFAMSTIATILRFAFLKYQSVVEMFAITVVDKCGVPMIRSPANKLDVLRQVGHDRSIDVLTVVESGHDVESVAFRCLLVTGYSVVDCSRPRQSSRSDLSTNHGGGAALCALPGVHPTTDAIDCLMTSVEGTAARGMVYNAERDFLYDGSFLRFVAIGLSTTTVIEYS